MDIETFSNAMPGARDIFEDPITVASSKLEAAKTLSAASEALQKFSEELEHAVDRRGGYL
jgi:hypothetical protein